MSESTLPKVATTVLVADDVEAADIADEVQEFCEKEAKAVDDLMEAMEFVERHGDEPLIILLDLCWGSDQNREGTYQFINWLRGQTTITNLPLGKDRLGQGQCGLILMSALATAEERYKALKQRGGILKKPITDLEGLHILLLDREDRLRKRRTRFKERLLPPEVIGECEALIGAYMDAREIVDTGKQLWKDQHIFIYGERGTGKTELVRAIHRWLGLQGEPLLIDCADITEHLEHSFFFGHLKGAFTGAVTNQAGQFDRLTDQGLVHIDNLHCLSRAAQKPLIKFLESGSYVPTGDAKRPPKQVKARLVVTTSEDPEEAMLEDRLMEDVWRRLIHGEWFITLPPLRERGSDVILLACHFCAQWKVPEDADPPREMQLSPQAEQALLSSLETYHWRGNVSDISGVVSHACRRAFRKGRRSLLPEDFPFQTNDNAEASAAPTPLGIRPLKVVGDEARKAEIIRSLRQTKGNIAEAARLLGVNRSHLQDDIIPKYGIDVEAIRRG